MVQFLPQMIFKANRDSRATANRINGVAKKTNTCTLLKEVTEFLTKASFLRGNSRYLYLFMKFFKYLSSTSLFGTGKNQILVPLITTSEIPAMMMFRRFPTRTRILNSQMYGSSICRHFFPYAICQSR